MQFTIGCLAGWLVTGWSQARPELTNYLISCFRQFICAAPRRRQQCVLETVAWAIIPLERGKQVGRQPVLALAQTSCGITQCQWSALPVSDRWRGLPNAFGLTSSLVNEWSPSSSSDTSTSSSCNPFFGSQVILFSFFSRLRALANQQLTWDDKSLLEREKRTQRDKRLYLG